MPIVPTFANEVRAVTPGAALASPGALSQAPAALASGAEQLSGEAQAFASRYAEARRQADAANLVSAASQQLGEMQFRWSKTPDRQAAYDGFNQEAAGYTRQLLDGIQDPEIRAHVTERVGQEATIRGLDTQNAAWQLESQKRRGELDLRTTQYADSAAAASSDEMRAKIYDDARADISSSVAAGWLRPDEGAVKMIALGSQFAEVRARQMLNGALDRGDADAANAVAQQLNDPSTFPGLLPERREVLAARAEGVAYRLGARDAARIAHEDAESARLLRQTQSNNETQLLSGIYNGKMPSPAMLEQLANAQQISPGGLEAIHSAMQRREEGRDDPRAAALLWAGTVAGGSTTKQDVFDAMTAGRLKTATGAEMMRTLNEREKQKDDAVERGAFATLRTTLSGQAVEQGLIKDDTVRAKAEKLWASAQGEWNRRVVAGNEDPFAVLSDMAPRYASALPQRPSWLPQPKFGAVGSLEDVKKVWSATKSAYGQKAISEGDYQAEARTLDAYRLFYAEKQARETKVPFAPGKAPASEATGAQ